MWRFITRWASWKLRNSIRRFPMEHSSPRGGARRTQLFLDKQRYQYRWGKGYLVVARKTTGPETCRAHCWWRTKEAGPEAAQSSRHHSYLQPINLGRESLIKSIGLSIRHWEPTRMWNIVWTRCLNNRYWNWSCISSKGECAIVWFITACSSDWRSRRRWGRW